jgi:alpha-ketoglutarate-dependent taurine dioxygenase
MSTTTLATRDIAPRIATEIRADKDELLSGVHGGEIRELLERRGVLVFPRVCFTDDEQVVFTQTLGSLAAERTGEGSITSHLIPVSIVVPSTSRGRCTGTSTAR